MGETGHVKYLNSTVSTVDGNAIDAGYPDLPETRLGPCQVTVDDKIMMFGGLINSGPVTGGSLELDLRFIDLNLPPTILIFDF